MRILDVEDPERMARHLGVMRRRAWDLEADFDWNAPIDVTRPLLPLAQVDRLFPGLEDDERLVLSQLFGIVIAHVFSDAEQFLNKTRDLLWPQFTQMFAGYPQLIELGTQFFDEERKHSEMFRRYIRRWVEARGLDPLRFEERQARFSESWQHRVIHKNAARGGLSFWWIVLLAEEESPLIYKYLEEDAETVEPLYLRVHRKHFEEEARHATFAYTAMAFLADRMPPAKRAVRRRTDIMLCQFLQWSFMLQAMRRERQRRDEGPEHPWVHTVNRAMRKVERLPARHLFRMFFREPTLLSPFMNYRFHKNMVEMVETRRLWSFPLPKVSAFADSPVNALS